MARRRASSGIAGLEFALISPVLLTLVVGTVDLSDALLTARRMQMAAGAVAEIASTSSVQSQALNTLTDTQAWQATTAAFALFPSWMYPAARNSFAITISYVTFSATPAGCTQDCSYIANVRWSVANDLGQPRLRTCGVLAKAPDIDPPGYATLPAGNFGPTSVLVADISFTFRPMFLGFIIGNVPMMTSAYISPRINNDTALVPNGGPGASASCPPVT